jgi:hypothetical protein
MTAVTILMTERSEIEVHRTQRLPARNAPASAGEDRDLRLA